MSSNVVTVREAGAGATIVVLTYMPWPVTWDFGQLPADGYNLAGRNVNSLPVTSRRAIINMQWGYAPAAFLNQLLQLPTDREVEMYLPVLLGGVGNIRWAYVRGWWEGPNEITTFIRTDYDRVTARLTGAREV